jgi:hypothetical protein
LPILVREVKAVALLLLGNLFQVVQEEQLGMAAQGREGFHPKPMQLPIQDPVALEEEELLLIQGPVVVRAVTSEHEFPVLH